MWARAVVLLVGIVAVVQMPAQAAVIWSAGPGDIGFTKAAFADPTAAASQDRITSGVWITCGNNMGIFNAKTETGFSTATSPSLSPANTEWAFSGLPLSSVDSHPLNPTFAYGEGATEHAGLTFSNWTAALGGSGLLQFNIAMTPGVVHLISEDIYIDIKFLSWDGGQQGGSGGGFSYQRATSPVPEPASVAMLGVGMASLMARRWRNRDNLSFRKN